MQDNKRDGETKKLGTTNDPLVLFVQAIEFEPDIHTERRKLSVDVEIMARDIPELVKKLSERMHNPILGAVRIRFIGRPV